MTPDANTAHDIAEEFGVPRQIESEGFCDAPSKTNPRNPQLEPTP